MKFHKKLIAGFALAFGVIGSIFGGYSGLQSNKKASADTIDTSDYHICTLDDFGKNDEGTASTKWGEKNVVDDANKAIVIKKYSGDTSYKKIIIPSSFADYDGYKIYLCSSTDAADKSDVGVLNGMFESQTQLTNIIIGDSNGTIYGAGTGNSMIGPDAVDFTVDENGYGYIALWGFHSMFKNCTSLKDVRFVNCDTSKVVSMEDMFAGCNLDYLDISCFKFDGIGGTDGHNDSYTVNNLFGRNKKQLDANQRKDLIDDYEVTEAEADRIMALPEDEKDAEIKNLFCKKYYSKSYDELDESAKSTIDMLWAFAQARKEGPSSFKQIIAPTTAITNQYAQKIELPCKYWDGNNTSSVTQYLSSGNNLTLVAYNEPDTPTPSTGVVLDVVLPVASIVLVLASLVAVAFVGKKKKQY